LGLLLQCSGATQKDWPWLRGFAWTWQDILPQRTMQLSEELTGD
jgi:hypothetical protein